MVFKKNKLIWVYKIFFILFLAIAFSTTLQARETIIKTQEVKIGQKAELILSAPISP